MSLLNQTICSHFFILIMKATVVKTFIESIYCAHHKEHPQVSVNNEGEISVECCCMQFQKQCNYLVNILSRKSQKASYSNSYSPALA
jgi:hypothetical protein